MTDHSDLIAAAMKRHLRISIDQDWEGMKYAILGIDEAAREIEALSSQSLIIENAALSIGASEIAGPVATSLSEARAAPEILPGCQDYATALSEAREEIERLRGALKPFAQEFDERRESYIRRYPRHPAVGASNFDAMPDDWKMENSTFTMGELRRARTALENRKADLADATNDPASSDLSSLRDGDGTMQPRLSSLRKDAVGPAVSEGGRGHSAPVTSGAEVAVADAARDLLFHLELYDFSERDPSGELNEKMADLKAALVSGSREDGASLLRTIETLPDDFTDDGNCCAGKLKEPRP